MKQIAMFSLEVPAGVESGEDSFSHAQLIKLGHPTGVAVRGIRLEAQYEVSGRFLLMLTEDCPYEESLHIYLLDAENSLLDEIRMGQPYTAGILTDLDATTKDTLEFAFFGNDRWKLKVLQKPQRMPLNLNSPQIETPWSRLLSKRFMELTRVKP
jgi:hypothetical protein